VIIRVPLQAQGSALGQKRTSWECPLLAQSGHSSCPGIRSCPKRQPLDRGWGKAWVILPHDGAAGDKVFATSFKIAICERNFTSWVYQTRSRAQPRLSLKLLGVTSRGSSSTRKPRKAAATRSAGITKRSRPMIETSGSDPITIGVHTAPTVLA